MFGKKSEKLHPDQLLLAFEALEGALAEVEEQAPARSATSGIFPSAWRGSLHDGRVEIDTNFVENRIRPVKLTAKNALFAGHDEGAIAWGRIASLIETCKMNDVEPCAWLKSTLKKSPPVTRNRASTN